MAEHTEPRRSPNLLAPTGFPASPPSDVDLAALAERLWRCAEWAGHRPDDIVGARVDDLRVASHVLRWLTNTDRREAP